jgi:hypothetical protein
MRNNSETGKGTSGMDKLGSIVDRMHMEQAFKLFENQYPSPYPTAFGCHINLKF